MLLPGESLRARGQSAPGGRHAGAHRPGALEVPHAGDRRGRLERRGRRGRARADHHPGHRLQRHHGHDAGRGGPRRDRAFEDPSSMLGPTESDTIEVQVPGQGNRVIRGGVQWYTSDSAVARVGPTGIVSGIGAGAGGDRRGRVRAGAQGRRHGAPRAQCARRDAPSFRGRRSAAAPGGPPDHRGGGGGRLDPDSRGADSLEGRRYRHHQLRRRQGRADRPRAGHARR